MVRWSRRLFVGYMENSNSELSQTIYISNRSNDDANEPGSPLCFLILVNLPLSTRAFAFKGILFRIHIQGRSLKLDQESDHVILTHGYELYASVTGIIGHHGGVQHAVCVGWVDPRSILRR